MKGIRGLSPNVYCRWVQAFGIAMVLISTSGSCWAGNSSRSGPDRSKTLCAPVEHVYFSCWIGKKTVSLCGSEQITKRSGYLQYRFGMIGKEPELIYPQTQVPPRGKFMDDLNSTAQSFSYEIGFEREGYSYRLFIDTAARVESFGYGLFVGRKGEPARKLKCTGQVYEDRAALWRMHDNQIVELLPTDGGTTYH